MFYLRYRLIKLLSGPCVVKIYILVFTPGKYYCHPCWVLVVFLHSLHLNQVNNQSELVIKVTWLVISQSGSSISWFCRFRSCLPCYDIGRCYTTPCMLSHRGSQQLCLYRTVGSHPHSDLKGKRWDLVITRDICWICLKSPGRVGFIE